MSSGRVAGPGYWRELAAIAGLFLVFATIGAVRSSLRPQRDAMRTVFRGRDVAREVVVYVPDSQKDTVTPQDLASLAPGAPIRVISDADVSGYVDKWSGPSRDAGPRGSACQACPEGPKEVINMTSTCLNMGPKWCPKGCFGPPLRLLGDP